jgi:hypothetical protein
LMQHVYCLHAGVYCGLLQFYHWVMTVIDTLSSVDQINHIDVFIEAGLICKQRTTKFNHEHIWLQN